MKSANDFFKKIHSWPEEGRQLIAIVIMFVAALVVFNSWGSVVTARLTPLETPQPTIATGTQNPPERLATLKSASPPTTPPTEQTVRGPLAGMADALRGVTGFIADIPSPLPYLADTIDAARGIDIVEMADQGLDAFGMFLYTLTK